MSDQITSEEYWAAIDEKMQAIANEYQARTAPWTEQEIAFLAKWYGRLPTSYLAGALNRTVASVRQKRYNMEAR